MFVDRVTVDVASGKGGDGCVSFRREKYVPRGGPDGGDGGNGGSVIVVAEPGVDSLQALVHRKHWKARSGTPGSGSKRHGANAEDLVIHVPPGTVVIDAGGDFVLKDLAAPGDQLVAARGGRGGKGNNRFKSATNQVPREFTRGGKGEERRLTFELKVIADVGLLGKPNAGKSTLLSRVSRARPEIADYPFTTKIPNLGIVQVDLDSAMVLADIPGLIEGAHAGAGLGHEFLRRNEVERYDINLADRPEVVAVSKAELPEAEAVREKLAETIGGEVLLFSSVTGLGLNQLMRSAYHLLSEQRQET